MSSWFKLDTHIASGRNPTYRKLANNTTAIRRGDAIAVRLHETDILTYHRDGTVTYDAAGWLTVTTKARFNDYGPDGWSVYSDRKIWHLYGPGGVVFRYWDAMRLDPATSAIVNMADGPNWAALDRQNDQTRRLIAGYVDGLTDETITKTMAENGMGDCFGCRWPDAFGHVDHLRDHLREHYYMPHLLLNAYRDRGYHDPGLVLVMDAERSPKSVRRMVKRYLVRQLIEAMPR